MNSLGANPLPLALRDPKVLMNASLREWEAFVRQARPANLLPRIAEDLSQLGLLQDVPEAPRAHLQAARTLAQAQANSVRREVAYIDRALAATGVPVVLLKGAAYLFAGLPAARGRIYSDVDILVPRDALLSEAGRIDVVVGERTVDVHISHLRAKLGDDPKAPRRIKTVRGVGYVLAREA